MLKFFMEIYNYLKLKLGSTGLWDTHCHLNSGEFTPDIADIIENAKQEEVKKILDVATDLESSKQAIDNSIRFPLTVKSFIGIDPDVFIPSAKMFKGFEQSEQFLVSLKNELSTLLEQNVENVIGIGETGMDYYWLKDKPVLRENSILLQEKLFRIHLELAEEKKLLLTIHSRGAEKRVLEILKEYKVLGILHSFTGGFDEAKEALNNGLGLGINAIITYKTAENVREVYKKLLGKIPNDAEPEWFYKKNIFFETDAPYLSPSSLRGKRNEPKSVKEIFNFVVNNFKF